MYYEDLCAARDPADEFCAVHLTGSTRRVRFHGAVLSAGRWVSRPPALFLRHVRQVPPYSVRTAEKPPSCVFLFLSHPASPQSCFVQVVIFLDFTVQNYVNLGIPPVLDCNPSLQFIIRVFTGM